MKFFKWKIFLITSAVCLLPILIGLYLWNSLPETIPIHFNIYGEPDNYASKSVVVFILPLAMLVAQTISCLSIDYNSAKYGESKRYELAVKLIVPFITVALQVITVGYGLGWEIDITKSLCIIVGIMFVVLGRYMPEVNYVKNYNLEVEKAKKINKFAGVETVIMGVIFLIGAFLPAKATAFCPFLLIPYVIIYIVYSLIIMKK